MGGVGVCFEAAAVSLDEEVDLSRQEPEGPPVDEEVFVFVYGDVWW